MSPSKCTIRKHLWMVQTCVWDAWNQRTDAEDGCLSEAGDILRPAVKLLKMICIITISQFFFLTRGRESACQFKQFIKLYFVKKNKAIKYFVRIFMSSCFGVWSSPLQDGIVYSLSLMQKECHLLVLNAMDTVKTSANHLTLSIYYLHSTFTLWQSI